MQFDVTAAGVARALFDEAPYGIFVSDSAGAIVDVNPAALRTLGYSREELVGRRFDDLLAGGAPNLRVRCKAGIEHAITLVRTPCEIAGNTFFLSFVRERSVDPVVAPAVARTSGTVLVVDDDPQVLRVVESVLSRGGYRVFAARNAGGAVMLARDVEVDALVTDLVLPGLSGLAVASAVLAFRPATKVLYMSGMHQLPPGRLQPGTAFLAKPFAPDELLERLRELLT